MNKTIETVGVVVLNEEKVLLVKHGDMSGHITGTYGLPAGRVDEGESLEDSALRELKEESGLEGFDLQKLPKEYTAVLQRKDGEKKFHMTVFLCKKYKGELTSTNETEPIWIDLNKINDFILIPNVENAINQAIAF